MLKAIGRIGAVSAMALLAGCLSQGNIDRRATTFNEQIATFSNKGVLLNLARASREEPIYFAGLGQLSSTSATAFRVGAPQFFLGPSLPAVDKIGTFDLAGSTYLDNNTNSVLQVSMLTSDHFYNGILGALSLRDVDLLLHQGYSRELIFYLVIDKAKITVIPPAGSTGPAPAPVMVFNDPSSPTFGLFKTYIQQAMEHGLTTNTFEGPNDVASAAPVPGTPAKAGTLSVQAELCYDKALALPADLKDIPAGSFCGDKPSVRTSDTGASGPLYVKLNGQQLQIDVTTRSIYQIYYYLGRIIASGKEVDLQPFDLPAEKIAQEPLITVAVDSSVTNSEAGGACFSATSYEGKTYCVPREGADNTKRIFGILYSLVALKQSVADLPNTQTVRIQP
ncbi:MAG TPA: hypothetical protein VHX64_00905 [Caulobacteraceae bacterium]|nr:hypothetical protein [Caulobacteraceae bacterium]